MVIDIEGQKVVKVSCQFHTSMGDERAKFVAAAIIFFWVRD
jgi:hypothetical protein